MAKIVKLVDRGIAPIERTQSFTNSDASTGDILDLTASLGKQARQVRIVTSASSDLVIRRNVVQKIFPDRGQGDGLGTAADLPYKHLGNVQEIIDATKGSEPVGGTNAVDMVLEGPIGDLEVTWSTGTWTVVAS